MRPGSRAAFWAAALGVTALTRSATFPQDAFTLGFEGPDAVAGESVGESFYVDYFCTLTHRGNGSGAQGWSVSLAAENGEISNITIQGTDAAALFSGGFEKSELTAGIGNAGAVSAVALSLTEPAALPANSTRTLAKVLARFVEPSAYSEPSVAALRFVDGMKGSSEPVKNVITQEGQSRTPFLAPKEIRVGREGGCFGTADLNVGFSAEKISSPLPYEGILGDLNGAGAKIIQEVPAGQKARPHVYANIVSNLAGPDGAQAWSFSILFSGYEYRIAAVTTAGTSAEKYFHLGFNQTEIADSSTSSGRPYGVISAVVLAWTESRTLPPVGTETILDITLEAYEPQEDEDLSAELAFQDGLRGSGQPVLNTIVVHGDTHLACNSGLARIEVGSRLRREVHFVRGNSNDDAKVNIADAMWILNEIFHSGPKSTCEDAADANNDGHVDSADAMYLIEHQFRGGSSPPAPYPDCGSDPEGDGDGLTCVDQARCL